MIGVNLIPWSLQVAQRRRLHMRRWAAAALIAGAMLCVPAMSDRVRQAEASELGLRNRRLQAQLAGLRRDVRSISAKAERVQLQIDRAEALRSKRSWSALISLIGQCMPDGSWSTSIATDPPTAPHGGSRSSARPGHKGDSGGPTTVVIEAPRRLRISGYATDAVEPLAFVTNLKSAGVFRDVSLESSRREPVLDGSYFRFSVVCDW